jgi:RNA polymerase sigma-70 factor (ECF subfamily)
MVPSSDEFAMLLEKARKGDLEARAKLFALVADEEALGADLLAAARRILPPRDRARGVLESHDLIQTALRVGWVDAAQFEGSTIEEFLGWLRTILKRKLLKAIRRKRPDVGLDPSEESAGRRPGRASPTGPLDQILKEEVKARVRKALAMLPDDQRAVVTLRLQGLDSPRIAGVLGLEPDAVRKRESRAAKRLREILADYGKA